MHELARLVRENQNIAPTDIVKKEVIAKLLGVTPRTLDRWHTLNQGPPRVRVGGQVRYRMSSVHRWLANREHAHAASS